MRLVSALAAVLVVTGSVSGTAACNLVPPTRLGDGASAISGYTVSNITYTLDSDDPRLLYEVAFDLDGFASDVWARIDPAGSWVQCAHSGGNRWSCKVIGQSVQSATELRVVAAQ